jgi:hypothetical protein
VGPGTDLEQNLAPTGIRSPDRPARSESLYRMRYPGPHAYIKQHGVLIKHKIQVQSAKTYDVNNTINKIFINCGSNTFCKR